MKVIMYRHPGDIWRFVGPTGGPVPVRPMAKVFPDGLAAREYFMTQTHAAGGAVKFVDAAAGKKIVTWSWYFRGVSGC